MYMNKAIIVGNVTKDPELKALPSGIKVIGFSIATNRVWKDKSGAKQESVEYHNIVAFSKQAEVIGQYVFKGSQLLIEGRIQTRSWENPDGKKNYKTEIIVENFQFGNKSQNQKPKEEQTEIDKQDELEYPNDDIDPDDIPF